MAINLHLARTYGAGLYPTDPDDLARTEQWSVWAISEIEPYQMAIVVQKVFTPEEKRSERSSRAEKRSRGPWRCSMLHSLTETTCSVTRSRLPTSM